jgi:hypothetical protein
MIVAYPRPTRREKLIPHIQVRVIKDVFSKEQKREIISKLTNAMVSIEVRTCAKSPFAWSRK